MSQTSKKKDKSIYQQVREELGYSREKASGLLHISADQLEKYENEKTNLRPDVVLAMSDVYKRPRLCNYYCSQECPIGQQYVPKIETKELSQIILEMLAHLNAMSDKQERLIEITADGLITSDEIRDFVEIQERLEKISITVETLQFWTEQMMDNGKIDMEAYNAFMKSYKKK